LNGDKKNVIPITNANITQQKNIIICFASLTFAFLRFFLLEILLFRPLLISSKSVNKRNNGITINIKIPKISIKK
jgi:hypothetical protein